MMADTVTVERRIRDPLTRVAPLLAYLRQSIPGTVLHDLALKVAEMEAAIDDLDTAITPLR